MLLDWSDCAATMTRSSRTEHLDATASSRQGLLLLKSARDRNNERSGARARLDATALNALEAHLDEAASFRESKW